MKKVTHVKVIDGFTLIELLISVVVALIVFLALARALMIYTRYNVLNVLRNRAISIAQACVSDLRSEMECPDVVTSRYRNFTINFDIAAPNPNDFSAGSYNNIKVVVSYKYGSKNYSYSINTMVYKQ